MIVLCLPVDGAATPEAGGIGQQNRDTSENVIPYSKHIVAFSAFIMKGR